jgi:hypothetical protein
MHIVSILGSKLFKNRGKVGFSIGGRFLAEHRTQLLLGHGCMMVLAEQLEEHMQEC